MLTFADLRTIHRHPVEERLYLEVSLSGEEFLYHGLIAAGNGLALAQGTPNRMADPAVVHFERRGSNLVLIELDVRTGLTDPILCQRRGTSLESS